MSNLGATIQHDHSAENSNSISVPRKYRRALTSLLKTGRGTVACPELWIVAAKTSEEFPVESSIAIPVA